jgi:hypothetical protein
VSSGITFTRLTEVDPAEILAHMSDPKVAEHMPLLTFDWDEAAVADFVAMKEDHWRRDGLGHWAILSGGRYVGWGGFRRRATNGITDWCCGPMRSALARASRGRRSPSPGPMTVSPT